MATLHYAANTTPLRRRFTSQTLDSRKHPILLISSSLPAKPTRRKNHLRQKILKTLERPIIPKLPPSNPTISVDAPPFQENEFDSSKLQEIQEREKPENSENEEVNNFEELKGVEVSKPAGVSFDENLAKKSILSYGFWLVGAFVFQTVYAIWVFSSAGTDNENQSLNETEKGSVIEVGGHGESKSRGKFVLYGNGNRKMGVENSALDSLVYVDELDMESKIDEIRVMARKARDMERLESKKNGLYCGDEIDGGKYFQNGTDLAADDWLIKLRKKLEKVRGKMPVASMGYLKKQNEIKDVVEKGLYDRDINGDLLFKKKYKFKGMSANPTEKPKGFVGSDNTSLKSGKEEKGNGFGKPKVKDGIELEKNNGKKLNGEVVSKKSSTLDVAVVSGELSKGNDSFEGKRVRDASLALERESGTDVWWLNLPYALAIVMRRGNNGVGGKGFYTVNSISSTDDQISHIVAFEDRGDATNFCYLLQSFFEDLEDFEADVVPLIVKDLIESAKYYNFKVLVVKKGQLRLYAGQPLADAEVALRAMIQV